MNPNEIHCLLFSFVYAEANKAAMPNNRFPQAFKGGDTRRVRHVSSAIQSAPHRNSAYLEPNSQSMQKPVEGVYPHWRFFQPLTPKPKLNLFIEGV
jgi:hypothetical protein